jgi:hypothetical protein
MGWSQNILILKLKTDEEKQFYMEMTRKYGWSVRMLERQIESNLFRQAKSNQENFAKICKSKDETVVEYTLRGMGQPLGISTYSQYKTLKDIPAEVTKYLPRKEEIVKRLSG